jgi:hypothetical protein
LNCFASFDGSIYRCETLIKKEFQTSVPSCHGKAGID